MTQPNETFQLRERAALTVRCHLAALAVLIVVSVFLTLRVRSLLVGRSADPQIQDAIQRVIAADGDIENVFNTITVQFGPDTMLAAKIRLRSGISVEQGVAAINKLERQLKQEVPDLKWSFVEPDTSD